MTEPTDNELDIVLSKHWPAFATVGALPLIWIRAAFREAIAKWGAPPQISESDTDYWVRNRALILRAIEERGFRLVSSGGLFWLHGPSPPAQAGTLESAEFGRFLSDVLTAAGLVTHGKQCKALGERLADMCAKLRHHGIKGGQHG